MTTAAHGSFEQLLTRLSSHFVCQPVDQIDEVLNDALRQVVEHFDLDRSSLAQFEPPGSDDLWLTHSWARESTEALSAQPIEKLGPQLATRLRAGQLIRVASAADLPEGPGRERFAASGLRSNLTLPVKVAGDVVGALAFGTIRREESWEENLMARLRLVSELFASVLVRRRDDAEIRRLAARLEAENVYLREEIASVHGFREIVGTSPPVQGALYKVEQVAPTDAPVLILGETGTGKELFARAVHDHSPRSDRPLVKVNCAALPSTLIESELFGHVKGAFTGATAAKAGRFELADGGTIFLDEIGDMELELQAKLLRVLQEGEFEPVGSARTRKIDVRVIAATNRDLREAMQEGSFRSDLYYRLNVFPIELPPLRERHGDLPKLVRFFVERGNKRLGRQVEKLPSRVVEALEAHEWPGNVRELQNVIDRALILSPGDTLELDPTTLNPASLSPVVNSELVASPETAAGVARAEASKRTLAEAERDHVETVLEECGWRINGPGNAAEWLGIHPSTLRHRMKKLGIQRPR